jgi:hypothetical protein
MGCLFQALNNLLVVSRDDAGAEAILAYDTDLQRLSEFIQRHDRMSMLGTLRVLSALAKNSYKRVSPLLPER